MQGFLWRTYPYTGNGRQNYHSLSCTPSRKIITYSVGHNQPEVERSEYLPSLATLLCGRNEAITDDGIENLVAKCHSIKELWIGGCPSISDRSVLQIAYHCPALERLDVEGNHRITAVSLGVLGAKCLELETVYTWRLGRFWAACVFISHTLIG